MKGAENATPCKEHRWERRLEMHHGAESVVRVCVRCGERELCWARRGRIRFKNEKFISGTACVS